jgi:hypothetical protein
MERAIFWVRRILICQIRRTGMARTVYAVSEGMIKVNGRVYLKGRLPRRGPSGRARIGLTCRPLRRIHIVLESVSFKSICEFGDE